MLRILLFALAPLFIGVLHFTVFQFLSTPKSFHLIQTFYLTMLLIASFTGYVFWMTKSLGQRVFTGIILMFISIQLIAAMSYLAYIIFNFGKSVQSSAIQCCLGFFLLLILQSIFAVRIKKFSDPI
jgi:hypothetical protein